MEERVLCGHGTCSFCGQGMMIREGASGPEEANRMATELCECYSAKRERDINLRVVRAEELMDELFADGAETIGFMPLNDSQISMIRDAVKAVAHGYMRKVTYEIPKVCKAEVSMNSKGLIEIKRTEGRTVSRKES